MTRLNSYLSANVLSRRALNRGDLNELRWEGFNDQRANNTKLHAQGSIEKIG